jgi:hypothetical protein
VDRRVVIAIAIAACSSKHGTTTVAQGSQGSSTDATPVLVDGARAGELVGKAVTVRGTARDAKISAVVVAGDFMVYCLGTESWPAELGGKQVDASGTLERTDEFTAKPGPNGEISAGTDGPVWVLRGCRYTR